MDSRQRIGPCKICGNKEKNLIYKVKERQINRGGYSDICIAGRAELCNCMMRLKISVIIIPMTIIHFI